MKLFKKIFVIVILLVLSQAASHKSQVSAASPNYGKTRIQIKPAAKTLRVGEKFVYRVYWNGIHIGEGIMDVQGIVNVNGRDAYHVVATAKSNEFLSNFYRVEDVIQSYIDVKDFCTLKFEKQQLEGKYRSDEVVVFDQVNHKGYYESLYNKSKKEFAIPERVHDLLSLFYYFRTLDVTPNTRLVFDVNSEERNWKTTLDIMGTENIEILRKGTHDVFCVQPKAPFKGVISKRGKAWVYFTADERRIPVLIKIRIPFGFVYGVLESME